MRTLVLGLILAVGWAVELGAQGGDGSLRGTVTDYQGAAMPGVTITATSPALLSPSVALSDDEGNYRLINLPPGTYTLTAELTGFAVFRREAILLRAGANFQVDIAMELGTLQETVTVSGDSPMIEVSRPSNVPNIDATFQKALPLVEGKYWSDFLHMTPGVMSRPHNDGSGRQNYFGNAVDHRDAVVDMEGMMASNYSDEHQPDRLEHRGGRGRADQDRRRRRRLAHGIRPRAQHDQQERRQPASWLRRMDVPALPLEQ
ncbi:MAG: carboxypeptidase-like regulatory domain-containing protein [Vicinamibacterales bacterium]